MATADDVLRIAISKLGQKETAPNQGEIVQWAMDAWIPKGWDISKPQPETGKTAWALWCAGFVSTCYLRAGFPFGKLGSTSVTTLYNRCKKAYPDSPRTADYSPNPGDIIFFKRGKELVHVGLVEKTVNDRVYTIEGNKGNEVARRDYSKKDPNIYGYITLF